MTELSNKSYKNDTAESLHSWLHMLMIKTKLIHTFYRATLSVSSVFAVARCPSVCPSLWWIVSRRLKISSNFFLSLVAPSS